MVSEVSRQIYWSKLEFRKAPADTHGLHRSLWRAFEGDERRCFLFRADPRQLESGAKGLVVLVQSEREADWGALGSELGDAQQVGRSLTLAPGQRFRFLLRANPTVARKGRDEPKFADVTPAEFHAARGRRVALFGEEQRNDWLRRRLGAGGWEVRAATQSNTKVWRWTRGGNRARHDGLDFEGLLEVRDADRCMESVLQGVGAGKAFGFGLISLAPTG